MNGEEQEPLQQEIDSEHQALLERLQDWLEIPMVVLAFVWLGLFIVEVVWGVSPLLQAAGNVIWILFIFEFVLGFTLAPGKLDYLKYNWLKGIALLAPALRIFRIVRILHLARLSRAAGMTRGLRLLRVLSSTNRGMRALGASMNRRGFGYVVILTLIVTLAGAAGMYAFESNMPDRRVLCFVLALYSFGVFGYVTATLASFFIGSDAENDEAEIANTKSINGLRKEIEALREEIHALKK